MVDTGYSRRAAQSGRELQPVAIVSVDPNGRTAVGMTGIRTTVQINCAYATGDTITVPAVGEQWYVERHNLEWRLYGRIPFNDATLNIEPVEGQVSVGSAVGPLELNGSEVRANGMFRLNSYYYRDNGTTLQRSSDGIHWESISAVASNSTEIIASASDAAAAKIAAAVLNSQGLNGQGGLNGQDGLGGQNGQNGQGGQNGQDGQDGLDGFVNGLDTLVTNIINTNSKIQDLYTRITSAKDQADEAFRTALGAKIANNFADTLVEWKARAGSNLVLDGAFRDATLKRFPLNDVQESGYALNQKHHSGLQSWIWTQFAGIECGFKMAPTERINHFDVAPGEIYFVESWIYPNILNTITSGSIRIGGTLSDTGGVLADTNIYLDYPQNGPDVIPGQWNKINIEVTIPDAVIDPGTSEKVGYDKIVFWIKTTANTVGGNQYWIDDVLIRENTFPAKAKRQADLANFIVNLKAWAGTNLFIDPKFSNTLVKRFPYNDDQVYEYTTEERKSFFHSWTWIQETHAACGLVLAPTQDVENIQVNGGELYTIDAYIFPKNTNSGLGEVRVGATFTDLQGVAAPIDKFTAYNFTTQVPEGVWTPVTAEIEVPGGYELGKFWIIVTEGAAALDVFYVDNVVFRESTASVRAQRRADFASNLVEMKARSGGNLVIDPDFSNPLVDRFSYAGDEVSSYSTAQHHSGFRSWTWTQKAAASCGFIMNPTSKIDTYQVAKDDNFVVSAWVYPTVATGAIRIGATLIDATGTNPSTDIFSEYVLPAGAAINTWTQISAPVVVSAGYDTAKFWVVATPATPVDSVFYIDDVAIRDNTAVAATTLQANLANFIVEMKARGGGNLVIDPNFSNTLVDRFPYNPNELHDYTTLSEPHNSGLRAWKWTQSIGLTCGIIFNPTTKVSTFQVARDENYLVSCWIHPKSTNTTTGTLRIGATLTDSSGTMPSTDLYTAYSLATEVPPGNWTQVSHGVVVPPGYDTAQFWAITLTDTPAGSIFYIDDLNVRDNTVGSAGAIEANLANFLVGMKAKAGSNLVIDPNFSNALVDRFAYNPNEIHDYTTLSEPRHSGLQAWKWTHSAGLASGFIFNPTSNVNTFQVNRDDNFIVSTWIQPKSTNTTTGTIRIGATLSDSSGGLSSTDTYVEYNLTTQLPLGQWTQISAPVVVTAGYDTAQFWVIATAATTAGNIFYIDDIAVRDNTVGAASTAQANLANFVVGMKAKAGANLVIDPNFSNALVDRFPYYINELCGYTNEQHHSGLKSWKWTHSASTTCGFIMNPTGEVSTFQVNRDDSFSVSCWIYPKSTNTTTGNVRIGATLTDSSGGLTALDIYQDYPLATSLPTGQWTQIGTGITVPDGYDEAKFWVTSVAATTAGNIFYIDDVNVRDNTEVAATKVQANLANFLVDLKGKAGANLVIDPKFSNSLVDRFPYYANQTCDYTILSEPRHSGLKAWKWTQSNGIACGLVLQPTVKVDSYEVKPGEQYYSEAWVHPKSTNPTAAPTIRIGVTFSDSSGTLTNADYYTGGIVTRGQWNLISNSVSVPAGFDGAKFWVIAPGTTPTGEIFYIDDVQVKEMTDAQNITDNLHQGLFGGLGTGKTPGEVKGLFQNLNQALFRNNSLPTAASSTGLGIHVNSLPDGMPRTKIPDLKNAILNIHNAINRTSLTDADPSVLTGSLTGLAILGRSRNRAGSNLILDPKVTEATATSPWATYATNKPVALSVNASIFRSGTQSLQATGAITFSLTINDLGVVTPIAAQLSDIFYVEAWVSGASTTATLSGLWVKSDVPDTGAAVTGVPASGGSLSATPTSTSDWRKISGYFTIPATASSNYDSFNARITTTGTVYVDDMAIREVTRAEAARATNQKFINRLHEALNGGTITDGVNDQTETAVKTLFQNLNQALFRSNSAPASGTSANIDPASVPNLGSGVARTKFQDLRETIDNIHNAITGGATSSNLPSVLTTSLTALTSLGRGRNRAGSNMLLDPKISNSTLWTSYATLNSLSASIATNTAAPVVATGNQNLMITVPAGGTVSFDWTLDDQGKLAPIAVEDNDVIHVECVIYGATANTVTFYYKQAISITGAVTAATTIGSPVVLGTAGYPLSTWNKVALKFTVPASVTYDSIVVGATVTGTSGQKVYFDDLLVRENTVGQNIIDNIHQAAAGGVGGGTTLNTSGTVKTKLLGLFNLGRGQTGSGSNLLADPKASVSGLWTSAASAGTLTVDSLYKRSTSTSMKLVSTGTAKFDFTTNDSGALQPIITQEGDTFYCEAYVLVPTTLAAGTITLHGEAFNLATPATRVTATIDVGSGSSVTVDGLPGLTNPTGSTTVWNKLAGYFTIPAGYDGFTAGITVSGTTTIYVDDMLVRETTVGNHLAQAFSGDPGVSARPLPEVFAKIRDRYDDILHHGKRLDALESTKTSSVTKGGNSSVDFGDYSDNTLLTSVLKEAADGGGTGGFTVSSTGGTSLGISNGTAGWQTTINGNASGTIVYYKGTQTDYQLIKGTMSVPPQQAPSGGSAPKFHAIGRVGTTTIANDTYVFARAYASGFLTYRGEIGCKVGATETVWASNIPLTWSTDMTFALGVGTADREYQVYSGGKLVWKHTETPGGSTTVFSPNYTTLSSTSGVMSSMGASFRKWGAVAKLSYSSGTLRHSGRIGATSVADNAPVSYNGSYARMYRTDTGGLDYTTSGTAMTNFFTGSTVQETLDVDANPTNGTFTNLGDGKPFIISARSAISGSPPTVCTLLLQRALAATPTTFVTVQRGEAVYPSAGNDLALTGNWIQYLNKGDVVRLAAIKVSSTVSSLVGVNDGGASTYFSITGAG